MAEVMKINIGMPHTAITTWSGFIYQGKVAIYHVVSMLDDLEACKEFSLQLDSLDDFSIINGDDEIVSLHQVKAKKTQYFNGYEEAIVQLKDNSKKYGCDNALFHVAQNISDKTCEEVSEAYPPVEIYKYGEDCWCAVDEIDSKIESKLKGLFYTWFVGDISKQSQEYLGKSRSYLDQVILIKVLEIHKIIHDNKMHDREAAYTQTVKFLEFIEILKKDLNQEALGEDYYFYLLLEYFHRYYQEYCIEHEELTNDDLIELSACMKEIESLGKPDMIQFVCNIMPHREFEFSTLEKFKDSTFDKDGIQNAFLTILSELRYPEFNSVNYFYWRSDDKSFSPTTIDKGASQAGNVCKDIIDNALSTDLDIMFEGSNLITTDINVDAITEGAPDLIQSVYATGREYERILRWKKVSLVSLPNAKDIIND